MAPTVLERIRRAAMAQAFSSARQLGYAPVDAYRKAAEVARYINVTAGADPSAGGMPDALER